MYIMLKGRWTERMRTGEETWQDEGWNEGHVVVIGNWWSRKTLVTDHFIHLSSPPSHKGAQQVRQGHDERKALWNSPGIKRKQ